MRAVIQRVSEASVTIAGKPTGAIKTGLLVLVGIHPRDTAKDIAWLSGKIVRLRIFPDDEGIMNRSVRECGGDLLVVSQFTLFASTRKGNRPSYIEAAPPAIAIPFYEAFLEQLQRDLGKPVARGQFGADMQVALVNDGPVTIIIDSSENHPPSSRPQQPGPSGSPGAPLASL
jgi:D-tyrosyl-tRNA(Tyr) deacylase